MDTIRLIPCLIGCLVLLTLFPACSGKKTSKHVEPSVELDAQQDAHPAAGKRAEAHPAKGASQSDPLRTRLIQSIESEIPKLSRDADYVSSAACASCHPHEYESWHQTYHRTMTQLALPENVLSDFADTTIESAALGWMR